MSAPIVLGLRLFLGLTLYLFLGWVLLTIWRDIRQQGKLLAEKKIPGINLTIKIGEKYSQNHFSTQSELLLGRDPHCDIPLPDETVSVRHARLSYHHAQWWIEDLGSTNGTKLNKEHISIPTVVINGDQIECGKAAVTISLGIEPSHPKTQKIPKMEI